MLLPQSQSPPLLTVLVSCQLKYRFHRFRILGQWLVLFTLKSKRLSWILMILDYSFSTQKNIAIEGKNRVVIKRNLP